MIRKDSYDVCTACHDKYVQGATPPPPTPKP